MSLGILAHQESQLNVGQMSEEARVPERSTFRTRWLVAARLFGARITKSYRENRDSCIIVESRSIQPEPITQTITACIIPSDTGLVDLFPRRLADDQQLCGACQ